MKVYTPADSSVHSPLEWLSQPRMFWTNAQRANRLLWIIADRKQAAWRIPNRRTRNRIYARLCRREEFVRNTAAKMGVWGI